MRLRIISTFLLFITGLFFLNSCSDKKNIVVEKQQEKAPNVILIMTDDQGYGDLACLGNPIIKTPNLDKLHSESIRFTDFHVNAFCAPTRAALMTGRMSDRTHVRTTVYLRNHLNKEETTMAEFFKESGYRTGHFGKWHLGHNYPYRPMDRGFDEWVGHGDGGTGTSSDYWGNDKMNDTYIRNGKWEKFDGFGNDVFFDETMKFIKDNKDEPFFVYLATNIPHGPMNVLKKWRDQYENQDIPGSSPWGDVKDLYATLTHFDENLGKLRDFLVENNLDENTILIFLTDNGTANGGQVYNAGMRGTKGSVYEGGHRVPCFIHWPEGNIDKGIDIDRFTSHIDLLPTLIDLCKLKTPERGHLKLDGRSMTSLFNDKNVKWEDRVLFMHQQNVTEVPVKGKKSLVSTEKWRLINGKELYDVQTDPAQKNDVAELYPNVVKELSQKYDDYWNEIQLGSNPYPRSIIGSPHDEETWLTSDSWILDQPKPHTWNQSHVLKGIKNSGFWPVEIASDGLYQFDVRRWPKELNHAISAKLPENKISDISLLGKDVIIDEGKAIPTVKIRIKVGDIEIEKEVNELDVSAFFNVQLKSGPTSVQAWLIDANGNKQGAYYTYVKKI